MVSKFRLSALLIIAIGCYVMGRVNAVDHIVGGDLGWDVPPRLTYYDEWASSRVFKVHDKLVFNYTGSGRNLIQVAGGDYANCTMNQVIDMFNRGPVTVSLDKAGDYYFYDGVAMHCDALGVKLKVTVVEAQAPKKAPAPVHKKEKDLSLGPVL